MTAPRHLAQLCRLALLVAVFDLATKEAAVAMLQGAPIDLTDWLRLMVTHNDKGAFSISLGAYTRQLNLALTLCAIALMIPVSRDLARIDRWAPTALGLIVGAAFGNLTSLIFSSQGVVDFIAVRTGDASALVLNVADIAAYVGLGMLVRTAFLLVDRIRRDIPMAPALAVNAPRLTLVHLEREVPIPLAAGGVSDRTAIDVPTQDRLKRLPPAASVRRFHDLVADAPARSDEFTL